MGASEQWSRALERVLPELSSNESEWRRWARAVQRELNRWGHEAYELTLERADRGPGSGALHCWFWCESCHVSQLLVLDEPEVQ